MNLFKSLVYSILSLQEKALKRKLSKTIGAKNNSKRKKYYTNGCFLSLESLADSEKQKIEDELELILKTCNYNPNEVLEYVKKHGTSVYYIKNSKALNSIGENEGFVYPTKGFKALYLSMLVQSKFAFKTKEMFILTKGEINKYYFIYHFYNWYAFKHQISGMDIESQELLKKFLFDSSSEELKKLQLDDIYKLKDAIKQDKLAIEFVFKLCQKYESSKNALNKLKDKGSLI